ncbi:MULTISPECIES: hypothetical protein [unclassified Sporolactobacillus]|uniref:hypothetical protein n=1 Tax=unclassified Sporolactobacillus TaxID=2628533 RepID=UPI00236775F3|nr:hypothetical protein [Sporolactobacillus sp. CQH2019]MDD9150269.1 hypothetical protein [Sporolactobacillus sp. CQH2019]
MQTVWLMLSYFFLLILFFIFILLRLDTWSAIMIYCLIFWVTLVPLTVIFLEEKNDELNEIKENEKKLSEHNPK